MTPQHIADGVAVTAVSLGVLAAILLGLIAVIMAVTIIRAVIAWWHRGADSYERIEQLAAADDYPVTRPCPAFCGDLSIIGDPDDCDCATPCGKPWCTALRRAARGGAR